MNFKKWLFVSFITTFLVAATEYNSYTSQDTPLGEKMIPTVSGLDFNKVSFWVDTQPEYTEKLMSFGIKKLTEAGLYTKPYDSVPHSERLAALILTLNPISIGEKSPGKVLYIQKLELWEDVSPVRNTKLTVQSVTWSYGLPIPIIKDRVTINELEADADRLLSEFIRSYRMGNPK